MSDLFGFDDQKRRPRSPNGINVHRFLEGYGIDVLPYEAGRSGEARPANVIYGGRTVARLMRKDMERIGLVIRCIQVSNPKCFDDVMIWSVWKVVEAHFAHISHTQVIEKFRNIDVHDIKRRAREIACGPYGRGTKSWTVIYSMIALEITGKGMK